MLMLNERPPVKCPSMNASSLWNYIKWKGFIIKYNKPIKQVSCYQHNMSRRNKQQHKKTESSSYPYSSKFICSFWICWTAQYSTIHTCSKNSTASISRDQRFVSKKIYEDPSYWKFKIGCDYFISEWNWEVG
jgi:hypothetical protein